MIWYLSCRISVRSSRLILESSTIRIRGFRISVCSSWSSSAIFWSIPSTIAVFLYILARYIRLSALWTASSTVSSVADTPPMLTDNLIRSYPGTLVSAIFFLILFSFRAKFSLSISGSKSRNSSPPYLISLSVFLIYCRITSTTVISAISPAWWPRISLYNLKSSTSRIATPAFPFTCLISSS